MEDSTSTRSFKLPPDPTYGFVGVGVMGYGMAMNLRAKIPEKADFILCEINEARREEFIQECDRKVRIAHSPREVAEQAVSALLSMSMSKSRLCWRIWA